MEILNLHELEALAKTKLPQLAWDYYSSGADDERCIRRNVEAYEHVLLHYRVLVDVAQRSLATTVLGERIAMPIAVAPTAFHRLAHPDGELATVRGAGDAGTLFILSTLSNTKVEDVVAAASGPVWFQLYVYKDRKATEALVQRVEAAGCRALVLTVDAPLLGTASATSRTASDCRRSSAWKTFTLRGIRRSPRQAVNLASPRTSRSCSIPR